MPVALKFAGEGSVETLSALPGFTFASDSHTVATLRATGRRCKRKVTPPSSQPASAIALPPYLPKPIRMLRVVAALLFLLVPNQAATRPNVVFIIAGDLRWRELGCYGQQKIKTPHIDALAAQGTRFTQHYSGAPVCAPSRCVLMTGRHLGHAEIRGNQQAKVRFPQFSEGQHPISAEVATLPDSFRKAGYSTAAIGKWGLGPVGSTGDPNKKGFDLFFGYNCQAVAHSYYPRFLWRNDRQIEINSQPVSGHAKEPAGGVTPDSFTGKTYAPKLMIEEAEKFIGMQTAAKKPFFLYLAFI